MKSLGLLTVMAATVFSGCGEKQTAGSTDGTSSSPVTAPVDYLEAVHKGQQRAVSVTDTAAITKAVQLFQTEHGRLPKDLNELVEEKFLPRIPEAPHGSKIVYDPQTGQVKIAKQ